MKNSKERLTNLAMFKGLNVMWWFLVLVWVILLGVFCFGFFNLASASTSIPKATSDFYVNDFVHLFSDEQHRQLMENAVELAEKYDGVQVVVTTIESLNGATLEPYATEMYNTYGIGKDSKGLLILLSTGDRQIRVEVGKGMEAYINDSKAGRFIDKYALPLLKANKFDEGLIRLQEAFVDEIEKLYDAENTVVTENSGTVGVIGNEKTDMTSVTTKDSAEIVSNSESTQSLLLPAFISFIFSFVVAYCFGRFSNRNGDKRAREKLKRDFEQREAEFESQIESMKKNNEMVSNERRRLENKVCDLTNEIQNIKDELKKANEYIKYSKKVCANLDQMVEGCKKEDADMAVASEIDKRISEVLGLEASMDIVYRLRSVINTYNNASKDQQAFVKSDVKALYALYAASKKLKDKYEDEQARRRARKREISGMSGYADELDSLLSLKKQNKGLDSRAGSYFDPYVLESPNSLIRESKHNVGMEQRRHEEQRIREEQRRREEEEEEEERRRRMRSSYSSSSSSSHHSSNHFGGFGGSSGGGGASRGF